MWPLFSAIIIGVWASPVTSPKLTIPAEAPTQAQSLSTLYLGADPYSQALLRLQYDAEDKSLEWQLLNNGYVLSSQSHRLPESTQTVDNGLVFNGDQMVVAGRTTDQRWFIRGLNSQGEFQWQRQGEGRIYDLAFRDDGRQLYVVGQFAHNPLFMALNANSGIILFDSSSINSGNDDDPKINNNLIYKQLAVTGERELVISAHRESDGYLELLKWQAKNDATNRDVYWSTVDGFCEDCIRNDINFIAMKNDGKSQRFFVVTENKNGLSFELKDSTLGTTINKQNLPSKNKSSATWNHIIKVDAAYGLFESIREHAIITQDALLSDSQLLLTSYECLVGVGFKGSSDSYLVDLCTPPDFAPRRKLLQTIELQDENNSTTLTPEAATDETLEQILTAVEVTASVLGIIGAITLVTGFVSFMCSQWYKHKDNINNALDTEAEERGTKRAIY